MLKKSVSIVVILLIFSQIALACSSSTDEESLEEDGFRHVYESDDKVWWFKLDSVNEAQESFDELILEVYVRIDYKDYIPQEMTEIVLWYVSTEQEKYKSTSTTTFSLDGTPLET